MTCHVTTNVYGACKCGEPLEPAHVIEEGGVAQEVVCRACCKVHADVEHFVGALAATLNGEQKGFEF